MSTKDDEIEAKVVTTTDDKSQDKDVDKDEDVPQTFPQRLMEILDDENNADIITWLPHGKGFIIVDKKRFAEETLPTAFKKAKAKFTSFTRKLNRWNFVRVTRGPETGAYYHPMFLKGNMKLCTQMTCISAKAPQQLQPMDPVALGLGSPGQFYPTEQQRMQQQQYYAWYQQQQQAFMQYMMTQQKGGEDGEGKKDDAQAIMMNPYAFQQQFYAWQQMQMASPNGMTSEKGEEKEGEKIEGNDEDLIESKDVDKEEI
ncbi:hypothetical protein FisN_12Lh033 [Fistulifera solaris]|uniref:HSF-type DNA-binding domain-containing protein n=1 Tax=Fistulifera solaris TaxID=1519565 RepID=A0A1Z5KGP7_FISSO|nr:hypothetical protein FisN_12Lh033 [Fistulifera solaris]|eukprot:GAX25494.1 hypothetical protein FisN_12Lh033 [Fistulifera solaris]